MKQKNIQKLFHFNKNPMKERIFGIKYSCNNDIVHVEKCDIEIKKQDEKMFKQNLKDVYRIPEEIGVMNFDLMKVENEKSL